MAMEGVNALQDDELYLPRTVVNKLIKEIVPNIRVSTDARDLLLNCCTEFIHLLASEASDISERQQKKVISPEHVVEALTTLGFQEYVSDVKAVHKEYKEQASKHRKRGKSKLDRLGIPEEELARQQQQLFDEARQQQMESELLEHQQSQSLQLSSTLPPLQIGEGTSTLPGHSTAKLPVVEEVGGGASESSVEASGSREVQSSTEFLGKQPQESPSQTMPAGAIPQNAAITVASLQATSNLLQQAIAMASAQMVATNNAQLQQSTQGLSQNILLQQPALQAAFAAQCMAAQAQTKLPPQEAVPQSQPLGNQESTPESVSSQELSVAQMMMTLARASNQNTSAHNGGTDTVTQKPPDRAS